MLRTCLSLAESTGASGVQERLQALAAEVRAQPNSVVALLKLAHMYAQIWAQNQQSELLDRAMRCLERAVILDIGQYARQARQLVDGMTKQVAARQMSQALAKLKEMAERLDAKSNVAPAGPPPPLNLRRPLRP